MISSFKESLKKSIKYILGQKLIKILFNLVLFIALGIILEPEVYGNYSLHYAYALLGCAIVSGGLDEVVMKKLLDERPPTLLEMIFLKSFYFFIFSVLTIFFFSSLNEKYIYLLAVFFSMFIVSHAKMEAQARGKILSFYTLLCAVLFFTIKIILISRVENQVYFLGIVFVFENIFIAFIPFIMQINKKELEIKLKSILENFLYCVPLWVSSVLFILSARVDYYLINKNFDISVLGKYSLISRLVEQSYVLPSVILSSLMIILVYNNKNGDRNELKLYRISFYGGLLLGALVLLFSLIILNYKNLMETRWIIVAIILSLCIPFSSLRIANSKFMIIDNLQMLYLRRTILTFIFSVISTYYLISIGGVIGLCFAILFTIIFSSLIFDLLSKDTRKYFFLKVKAIFFLSR